MRQLAISILCVLAALGAAAPANADLTVGAADDGGRLATYRGAVLRGPVLQRSRVTSGWDPERPTTIREREQLDRYVPRAAAAGIKLVFLISPTRARALAGSRPAANQFVDFVVQVARRYPQVKDIAVGNEPNQPRFWQPQFSFTGKGLACASYERVLAQAYDALKAVNRDITVLGVSLSPRGNDNALAAVNASTSPVRCIHDIGVAYRASGRKRPIMDQLAFHPHPNSYRDG